MLVGVWALLSRRQLVFVEGMRCRPGSWWRVFLITNLTLIPIALVNLAIGANYFFICRKPGGTSPFLMGEWPWYILGFELLGGLFFWLLSLPMEGRAWRRKEVGSSGARAELSV
jgi:uncharacterized membrane protein YwaF